MSLRHLIKHHPVLSYFVLVFLLAWGGIVLIDRALDIPEQGASPAQVGLSGQAARAGRALISS